MLTVKPDPVINAPEVVNSRNILCLLLGMSSTAYNSIYINYINIIIRMQHKHDFYSSISVRILQV